MTGDVVRSSRQEVALQLDTIAAALAAVSATSAIRRVCGVVARCEWGAAAVESSASA